ncbi:MAG: NTPase [Chloroflexi bacterium]|nr:NTPase [Chloroflexota bacterium]
MGRVFLLTGRPGVGKTTLIRELSKDLEDVGGFYTQEIREGGKRQGFKILTLDGRAGILALEDIKGQPRVGRYGVNLADLEEIAVNSVQEALQSKKYILIDEIGKMELASPKFRQCVEEAINSPKTVIATIMATPHPFADAIKKKGLVLEVTLQNREKLKDRILELLARPG